MKSLLAIFLGLFLFTLTGCGGGGASYPEAGDPDSPAEELTEEEEAAERAQDPDSQGK